MKTLFITLALSITVLFSSCEKKMIGHSYETDFTKYFEGYEGGFILYDYNNKYYIRHNEKICTTRYSPCSTFKIPNTLLALQLGIISADSNFMKWDGTERRIESWNADQTLESAFKNSTVWYYQNLARQIGDQNYNKFLSEFNYGNQDISGGLENFWLYSSLTISPEEQVKFLEKIYLYDLPIDSININTLKKVMLIEESDVHKFSGKTGSGIKEGSPDIGWFVGAVELGSNIYLFATFIEGDDASGAKAKEISKRILQSIRII